MQITVTTYSTLLCVYMHLVDDEFWLADCYHMMPILANERAFNALQVTRDSGLYILDHPLVRARSKKRSKNKQKDCRSSTRTSPYKVYKIKDLYFDRI